MTRLLICICLLIFPMRAQANPELANFWGLEATRLATQTADLMHEIDLGRSIEIADSYVIDVHRFGQTSEKLARWNQSVNGAHALGCFFRGMATETETSLIDLESRADLSHRRESLHRLSAMFADAQVIAIAAQRRNPASGRVASLINANCATRIETSFRSLR